MISNLIHDHEFWVLVAAIIFVAVVWKPAGRQLLGALDERSNRIRSELEEARRLREEAQQLLATYQRQQRDAAGEAQKIVDHAKAEAERFAAQAVRDLEQSLVRRQRLAEERIAQAEAKALAEVRTVAVDVAILAARQVIIEQLDGPRGATLIDDAIAALPRQLH